MQVMSSDYVHRELGCCRARSARLAGCLVMIRRSCYLAFWAVGHVLCLYWLLVKDQQSLQWSSRSQGYVLRTVLHCIALLTLRSVVQPL
jgi:hypothetical protein